MLAITARRARLKQFVSVAGFLGYDVLVVKSIIIALSALVSVAGFLGYDVLVVKSIIIALSALVSVAGFLGYDVLDPPTDPPGFQLLVF